MILVTGATGNVYAPSVGCPRPDGQWGRPARLCGASPCLKAVVGRAESIIGPETGEAGWTSIVGRSGSLPRDPADPLVGFYREGGSRSAGWVRGSRRVVAFSGRFSG